MRLISALLLTAISAAAVASVPPAILLSNAARPGTVMPAIGLGTGAYGPTYYPNMSTVARAVAAWLQLNQQLGSVQTRIDASYTYGTQTGVAAGIAQSGFRRDQVFITSKVGPGDPLGYNETLAQFQVALQTLNTTYVDLLLIHWPGPAENSSDPACTGATASPRVRCGEHKRRDCRMHCQYDAL